MPRLLGASIGKIMTALGYDGAGFYPLAVDSDGQLQVDLAGDVLSRYEAAYRATANGSASSGTLTVALAAIATGKLVVVEAMYAAMVGGSATGLYLSLRSGGVNYDLVTDGSPVLLAGITVHTPTVLVGGENVQAAATGCGAGTTLYVFAVGHYVVA